MRTRIKEHIVMLIIYTWLILVLGSLGYVVYSEYFNSGIKMINLTCEISQKHEQKNLITMKCLESY